MKKILVVMSLVLTPAAALAQEPKQIPQVTYTFDSPLPEGLRDKCMTAKPAQTLALGEGPSVSAVSQGDGYAKGACSLFVAEIDVAQSSNMLSIGGQYTGKATGPIAISPGVPLSYKECPEYEEWSALYRKGADGTFAHIGGGVARGDWVPEYVDKDGNTNPAHCRIVAATSFKKAELTPGATYKIAFGAKVGADWRKVKVVGDLISIPK